MLGSVVTAIALAAAVSQVAAGPVNHVHHVPRGYRQDADILEDYTPYHVRYLALKCNEQHNTQFFEDCCHPLLRWQKLSDRPSQCTPSASASSAAAIAEPTSQPVDEDPIYDDDDCETTSTYHPQSTAAPSSTKAKMITSTVKSETTSYKPEPTTSSTSSKEPEPSKAATPQNTGGEVHEGGFATFYYQNGNAGACGEVHRDSDMIVAIDHEWWGPDFGVKSPLCGRAVRITNTNNGKSVQVNIADVCPSCTNGNSIDMSTGAFNQIATPDEGMVPISWVFV